MSDEASIAFAVIFLGIIPLNVWVALEVRRYAHMPPAIGILSLLARLVYIFAGIAVVTGTLAAGTVVFLATGIRVIPMPIGVLLVIAVFFTASFANVLVWCYLRARRRPAG